MAQPQQLQTLASESILHGRHRYRFRWVNIGMLIAFPSWLISMIFLSLYMRQKYSTECIDHKHNTNAFSFIHFMMVNLALVPLLPTSFAHAKPSDDEEFNGRHFFWHCTFILSSAATVMCFVFSLAFVDNKSCIFGLPYVKLLFFFSNIVLFAFITFVVGGCLYLIGRLLLYVVSSCYKGCRSWIVEESFELA